MMRKLWLFLLTIFCSSCTAYTDGDRERFENLPHRYAQFDMTVAWEIKQVGKETHVEGVVKNVRYAYMEGIEVWIAVVDAAGKTRARSSDFIIPRQLKQDEVAPFRVKLPIIVEPGMRLKFTYKYDGSDGGEGGLKWMQTFDWVVPPA